MRARTRLTALGLSLPLLALAACSSVRVRVQEGAADLSAARTYAWSPPPDDGGQLADADLAARIEAAVEGELDSRGYREVARNEADLLVSADVRIETRVAQRHAYNTGFYTADRFEDGVLAVRVLDVRSRSVAWEARGERRLRRDARGYGPYQLEWVETGEPRDWRPEELLAAMFARFPVKRVRPE